MADLQDWETARETSISHIAELLIAKRVGFLFGAGMSIPSGSISGSELAFQLILKSLYSQLHPPLPQTQEALLRETSSKFPLEAVAAGALQALPFLKTDLERLLLDTVFQGKAPESHAGHTALSALVTKFKPRNLYTTNWDELLTQALGTNGVTITESSLRKIDGVHDSGNTAVVHLHGTFTDNPLICEDDLMDPERPLFQLFLADLMTKAFVFVGYSLSDWNIRALYSRSRDVLKRRSEKLVKVTYVVSPPSSDVDRRVSNEIWKARQVTYIPMAAEDFFVAVQKELVTHAVVNLKNKLRQRLNVSLDDLNTKVDEIIRVFPQFRDEEQVLYYIDALTRGGQP